MVLIGLADTAFVWKNTTVTRASADFELAAARAAARAAALAAALAAAWPAQGGSRTGSNFHFTEGFCQKQMNDRTSVGFDRDSRVLRRPETQANLPEAPNHIQMGRLAAGWGHSHSMGAI